MNCPTCGSVKHNVLDTRESTSKYNYIRRRRECERCETRWTTKEFITDAVTTKEQAASNSEKLERGKSAKRASLKNA